MTTQAYRTYHVQSSRDAAVAYLVAEDAAGRLDCCCPDRQYRRNTYCKHVKAVVRGDVAPDAPTFTPLPLTLHSDRCRCTQCVILRAAADGESRYLAFMRDAHRRDAALVDLIDRAVAAAEAGVLSC